MLSKVASLARGRVGAIRAASSFPPSVANAPATEITTLDNGLRVASEVRTLRPVWRLRWGAPRPPTKTPYAFAARYARTLRGCLYMSMGFCLLHLLPRLPRKVLTA